MNYTEFLTKVVDNGIEAARQSYNRPDQKDKLAGSVAGFQACRDKGPIELKGLLEASAVARADARKNDHDRYWWYRCYEAEVEWVCNVVSCMLINQKMPPIVPPTARGMVAASKILGVAGKTGAS